MRAAWYERQGAASDVLEVGEMQDPHPSPGEVRIAVHASGVNTGDVKKRAGWLGFAMADARVIPHSDGAGVIDAVGEDVDSARVGERVWCHGAQSYRPFGTAAQYTTVPSEQAVTLPPDVSFETGACLGIPGITAHRAVFGDGPVRGQNVLVSGAAGAVGSMAVALASWGGARVLATVRRPDDGARAASAGADHVYATGEPDVAAAIRADAPDGVQRIVEVALGPNARLDAEVLAQGGTIAAYASPGDETALPFWPLLFVNATIRLLGSDDFPAEAKARAAADIVTCLKDGRLRPEVGARFALDDIAAAHEAVRRRATPGRVVVSLMP
ncbi:MAG: NADPH:quinone reductase [Solirubrobacteraceae bacterium]|nr:NADPH:quinone reductase [Solirubrobacteraceae bacterium]